MFAAGQPILDQSGGFCHIGATAANRAGMNDQDIIGAKKIATLLCIADGQFFGHGTRQRPRHVGQDQVCGRRFGIMDIHFVPV